MATHLYDKEWWESLVSKEVGMYTELDSTDSLSSQYQKIIRNFKSLDQLQYLLLSKDNIEDALKSFLQVATIDDLFFLIGVWTLDMGILIDYISYYLSADTLIEYIHLLPSEYNDRFVYNCVKTLRKEVYQDLDCLFSDLFMKYSVEALEKNEITVSDFERMHLLMKYV